MEKGSHAAASGPDTMLGSAMSSAPASSTTPAGAASFPKRRVEGLLLGIFLAVSLVLLVVGVIALSSVNRNAANARRVNHSHRTIELAQEISIELLDAIKVERGYLLTGQESRLATFAARVARVGEHLRRLRELTRDHSAQQANLDGLEWLIRQRLDLAQEEIRLHQAQAGEQARLRVASGRGQAIMDQVQAKLQEVIVFERGLLGEREARMEASARQTSVVVGLFVLLTLVALPIGVARILGGLKQRRTSREQVEQLNAQLRVHAAELAEARDAAEASGRFMAAILASAGNGIIATTPEGAITHFNPAAQQMTGHDAMAVLGCTLTSLVAPEDLARRAAMLSAELGEAIAADIEALLAKTRRNLPDEGEWTFLRKNGTYFPALLSMTSLRDADGRITGHLGLVTDITGQKEAEARLRSKNEELKAFAYTVSHDLKAPLRGISGYAQELERLHKAGLTERGQFCVAQIITASRNLDRLIEDLLKYSRLEAETLVLREVDLPELVQTILRDRGRSLVDQSVEWTLEVPPLTIHTWQRGLAQVLSNLIDNAVKYSAHAKPPQVAITATFDSGHCRVTVTDNGIGFDMKYHDRIFGLFNRLSRAGEFEGTGAGLAIVKKLTERLGGTIRAESTLGQGATFILDLPMSLDSGVAQ